MSITVVPTSKAMSDLQVIRQHVKTYNDAATARKTVNLLLDEAERLGQDLYHRLGEELDGYDDPPREVRRWVTTGALAGRYEWHYEVLPAFADEPTTIALLRVWDTRQDR
ncbi:type II toxin-antitoxin system RelE/ParE family toxin [Burkholderia gladioli]|uniref:type II toxin-antitoxin system RelE/ParE family toxin n=1 Tax=Burkholderia gladioli TaxID=28095 RepID=UPI000D00F09E|nr:type II toxin-antitoxin system RelE/ParE family toxin [Burkholderia gladioli]PRE81307.1 type II toxin-antitoxin system RelE/ParE family toxin [Burkholderia gladioli]